MSVSVESRVVGSNSSLTVHVTQYQITFHIPQVEISLEGEASPPNPLTRGVTPVPGWGLCGPWTLAWLGNIVAKLPLVTRHLRP